MNNKELRKLGRKDLLEIILAQTKRIEELETELKKTNSELNSKKIAIEESGSIAEAILKLSDIFNVAQTTADKYVNTVKDNNKKYEIKMQKEYDRQKDKMLKKVEKECEKRKKEPDDYIKDIEQKVNELVSGNADIPLGIKKSKRKKSV